MNEIEMYQQAIEGYIAQFQPFKWPSHLGERLAILSKDTLLALSLKEMPQNCLPLLTYNYWNPLLFGILADTRIFRAGVLLEKQPYRIESRLLTIYAGFNEFYNECITEVKDLEIFTSYTWKMDKVRERYPLIAPLLPDPPPIPPEVAQEYELRILGSI